MWSFADTIWLFPAGTRPHPVQMATEPIWFSSVRNQCLRFVVFQRIRKSVTDMTSIKQSTRIPRFCIQSNHFVSWSSFQWFIHWIRNDWFQHNQHTRIGFLLFIFVYHLTSIGNLIFFWLGFVSFYSLLIQWNLERHFNSNQRHWYLAHAHRRNWSSKRSIDVVGVDQLQETSSIDSSYLGIW